MVGANTQPVRRVTRVSADCNTHVGNAYLLLSLIVLLMESNELTTSSTTPISEST